MVKGSRAPGERPRPGGVRATKAAPQPPPPIEPAPLRHPLVVLAIVATLASVLLSVSYVLFDPDLFQHLLVGRVIWEMRGVPQQHLWTWAHYGTPEVLPSWLFRALLWPFWALGEVHGLYLWRWVTAAGAFGFAWLTARRLGARGLAPLVVIAICALAYRDRSMVRPETLAMLLMTLQIFILETRRQGGRDATPWLVGIALIWANAHISYHLGIWLQVLYLLDAWLGGRRFRAARALKGTTPGGADRLGWVLLASVAISFLNPFGWKALWQPFQFFFFWRTEPIYQAIGELQPITLELSLANRLGFIVVGWWGLIIWRALRRRVDGLEVGLALFFTALLAGGQRFVAFYSLAAAPFIGRGSSELLAALDLGRRIPLAGRAAAVGAIALLAGIPTWSRPGLPLGIRLEPRYYAKDALDFVAEHGVRGRGFTSFELAGYQIYRFWPNRERLPFMDIHPESARPRERYLYTQMLFFPEGWQTLNRENDFDYAILARRQVTNNVGLNTLDADTSFALVFVDDIAAVYARRTGPLAGVAERYAYALVPAGDARLGALQQMCSTDTAGCDRLAAELERAIAASPRHSDALSLLANVTIAHGDYGLARERLTRGLEVNPSLLRAHERLGMLALAEGRPRDALREFAAERRLNGHLRGLDLRVGAAYGQMGDLRAAERSYRRELARHPGSREAADSLAALRRR